MRRFTGFPTGARVSVSVEEGQANKGPVRARRWGIPDPRHTLEPTPSQSFGVSVTLANPETALVTAARPKTRFHSQIVAERTGRRIGVSLDNHNVLRDLAWIGAQVDAYRIVSGERTLIGTFTVLDANFGEWRRATDNDQTAHDGAGFSHRHNAFGKADENWEMRTRWFGVAAVDGSNQIGVIGTVSYTPTSLATGDNPANDNIVNLSANYGTGGALATPGNIQATPDASGPAVANVTHDAVPGAIGYMHFLSWDDPATHPSFKYIELDGDGVEVGDEIIVRQRFLEANSDFLATRTMALTDGTHGGRQIMQRAISTRSALWALRGKIETSFAAYDGPTSGGPDWAVRYDIQPAADQTQTTLYQRYWNAGSDQSFYHVTTPGATYRLRFEAYADNPVTIQIRFGLLNVPNLDLTLQAGWQIVSLDRVALNLPNNARALQILTTPNGSARDIRIAGLTLTQGTDLQEAEFRSDIAAQLLPGMLVRDHTFIKVLPEGYWIEDIVTSPHTGHNGYSLHQFLTSCVTSQCDPWLQIEPFLSPSEWDWFADYLCAPVSSGRAGALRRQELGRAAPWVDAFASLRLEFGNEAWNGLSEFYNPPAPQTDSVTSETYNAGRCFGLSARHAAQTLMANTYWSSKIGFTLGGRANRPNFGGEVLRGFRLPCHIGIANYNGGWDVSGNLVSEDDTSYQNTLASTAANQIGRMDNLVAELQSVCSEIGLSYGTDVRPTCYEAGPGYQFNGLNGASVSEAEAIVQEVVMKSRATGTATLHTALAQAARGFAHFNFFLLGSGDRWASHASGAQGGAPYPSWQVIRKLHEEFGEVQVAGAGYIFPETITVQGNNGDDVRVDATYAFGLQSVSYPGRQGFVLGNINRARAEYCTVATGWSPVGTFTGWLLTGPYDHHNRYPVGQRLNDAGGFVPDPNSVDITITGMSLFPPSDLGSVASDDGLGFTVDGIPPGCCGFFVAEG